MFVSENIQNLLNMYLVSGKQEALDVCMFLSVLISFHVWRMMKQLQKQMGLLSESGVGAIVFEMELWVAYLV